MPHFLRCNNAISFWPNIKKIEKLGHAQASAQDWAGCDEETDELLRQTFGEIHEYVESYALASMGEAEALVNMPESAQESLSQDLPQKAFQQRRQHAPCCVIES